MAPGKKEAPVNASDLENGIKIENEKWVDRKALREIQREQLRRILTFFMWANAIAGVLIIAMWGIEYLDPPAQPTITDKVIIAALAGITVQTGAIILSAFQGLFKEKR